MGFTGTYTANIVTAIAAHTSERWSTSLLLTSGAQRSKPLSDWAAGAKRLMTLIVSMAMACHMLGCAFFLAARLEQEQHGEALGLRRS